MKQATKAVCDTLLSNFKALEQLQNKLKFHDMVINSVARLNKRAIITLDDYLLILTGVTSWREVIDEYPVVWINHTLQLSEKTATVHIESDGGTIDAEFTNLRLIRPRDFAILIPSID